MNNGSSSISLSPLTSSEVRKHPYPAPLNSGRIGDFFAFFIKLAASAATTTLKPPWGLRVQAPFGAVGIGTGVVLSSIPEG